MGTRQLVQATVVVAIASGLSKILGFLRETAIAAQFGATSDTDAYLVAFIIPSLIFASIGTTITTVFIPVYTECYSKQGNEKALKLFRNVSTFLVLLVILLIALGEVLAAPLVRLLAPGFTGEVVSLTVNLTRLMFPSIFFMAFSGLYMGVLNATQHFTAPALVGLPYNIIIILSIIVLGKSYGIYGLAIGILLAVASQMAIQMPVLLKKGNSHKWVLEFRDPELRKMIRLMLPVLLGTAAAQVNVMVDRILASGLPEGSISALNFAFRIYALPIGIFVMALVTVIYPQLARHASLGNREGVGNSLARGLGLIAFLVAPMMVGMLVLRQPIVRVLFERGAFEPVATRATAYALLFYAVGLVPQSLVEMLTRGFWALQDTRAPMLVGIGAMAINIFLNLFLIKYLAHGGLALGSSLASLASMIWLVVLLRRKGILSGQGRRLVDSFARITVAATAMGLICSFLWKAFEAHFLAQGSPDPFGTVIGLVVVIIAGAITYGIGAYLLHLEEMEFVTELGHKVVGKIRQMVAAKVEAR